MFLFNNTMKISNKVMSPTHFELAQKKNGSRIFGELSVRDKTKVRLIVRPLTLVWYHHEPRNLLETSCRHCYYNWAVTTPRKICYHKASVLCFTLRKRKLALRIFWIHYYTLLFRCTYEVELIDYFTAIYRN